MLLCTTLSGVFSLSKISFQFLLVIEPLGPSDGRCRRVSADSSILQLDIFCIESSEYVSTGSTSEGFFYSSIVDLHMSSIISKIWRSRIELCEEVCDDNLILFETVVYAQLQRVVT